MSRISDQRVDELKKLYYKDQFCMREIAEKFKVSIDAVTYFMRKHNLKRRKFSQVNKLRFDNKPLSFKKTSLNTNYLRELKIIGAMLYWGEGYKTEKCKVVDFANSDPDMISIFINFLRKIYSVDEKRIRIYLYCHSNQNTNELIEFWSQLVNIPKEQFCKPYIRQDFNINIRKMQYGLVHIRYSDKKLFLEIKKTINIYKNKYLTC